MNAVQYQQLLMCYYDVLSVLAETLHQNAATLGLMAPGFPEQLGIDNGVGVTANGLPLFRAVVPRRNSRGGVQSIRMLRAAIQDSVDVTCFGFGLNRLCVLEARYLPGGYLGLTLTWGCW